MVELIKPTFIWMFVYILGMVALGYSHTKIQRAIAIAIIVAALAAVFGMWGIYFYTGGINEIK